MNRAFLDGPVHGHYYTQSRCGADVRADMISICLAIVAYPDVPAKGRQREVARHRLRSGERSDVSQSIYIMSAEGNSGKSTIALGLLTALNRSAQRVGVFRPVARSSAGDDVLDLLLAHTGVSMSAASCIGVTYEDVHADPAGAMTRIIDRFKAVEHQCDLVIVLGSDYTDVSTPAELGYNARIAANLGAPVVLVVGGRSLETTLAVDADISSAPPRTVGQIRQVTEIALPELHAEHAQLLAVIANRVAPESLDAVVSMLSETIDQLSGIPVWAIPEDALLVSPTMSNIMSAIGGTLLRGDIELLGRDVLGVVVAAMSVEHVLTRLTEGAVVIVAGDRAEILLAVLMAHNAATFPSLSGIVVNGGFEVSPAISSLIEGLGLDIPVVGTELATYGTALRITKTRGRLKVDSQPKLDLAISLFEQHVDADALVRALDIRRPDIVTPLMFEYDLLERARRIRKHIVLPEGNDDRILRAASTLLQREMADLTILGDETEIRNRATKLGLDLDDATIVSPFDKDLVKRFAEEYARIRSHKGMNIDRARDIVTDVSYFGTMMVHLGLADGMVSGAAHSTAHTIRPGFEIIKTRPGVSIVSSVFLMCLEDRVLVYGDCAINPDPTAEQLADIAISSAATASQFAIAPRVAMLSYSTGESGSGVDVEKVRTATALVRARRPDLPVDGPIQYDAAADATVAAAKVPHSSIAGHATVFIFPDLNTGNNTYKAVQRSAGAVAIGPVLQGLRKPINDLSRGALVADIVNTVAITVIQAQDASDEIDADITTSMSIPATAAGVSA